MAERTIRHTEDGPPGYRRFGTEVRTERGDEIAVDEDLADTLVDEKQFFEFVGAAVESDDDDGSDDADDGDEETKDSVVTAPEEYTIDEIEDELETGEYDDHLETLRENEEDGKDRAGVYDAIGVRRAELEE